MAEQGRGDYFIINTSILPGCLFPTEAWTKKPDKSKDIWKSLHQNKDGGNIRRFSISVHFCGLFLSCASVIRMNGHFEALCILITEWKQTLLWQNWENAADTEAVTGKCEYSANSTCKLILKKENTQRQKKKKRSSSGWVEPSLHSSLWTVRLHIKLVASRPAAFFLFFFQPMCQCWELGRHEEIEICQRFKY